MIATSDSRGIVPRMGSSYTICKLVLPPIAPAHACALYPRYDYSPVGH
jgi:hypothetical protein